jgi:glucose-6-phosphate isomerase
MPGSIEVRTAFDRFLDWRCALEDPAVELDLSLTGLNDAHVQRMELPLQKALEAMEALEGGAAANVDEGRMVGHYWLRAPGRAPDPEVGQAIADTLGHIEGFAASVHRGEIGPPEGGAFSNVLLIGIGGSALGPMLLGDVFGGSGPMSLFVLDNADPNGIERLLGNLDLAVTLIVAVSKSGGTAETRNGIAEIQDACRKRGLDFARRAVAVTQDGSALAEKAAQEGWIRTFPMWDWVGGRTSVFSAVGLLPGALIGMDLRGFLAGAAAMDEMCRSRELRGNPAAMLALFWYVEGKGKGERSMVVLPYRDRLVLASRYLQQLVMESLGKELDRRANVVHQGLTVYGNKGSTDQHAFVQQLRDGRHDFFVQFLRVLDVPGDSGLLVDGQASSGDYLNGFCLGTRKALFESGRHSVTLTLQELEERGVGALIALWERTVGLYAELIDVNAYHQPGVEAGKQAARQILKLQTQLFAALGDQPRGCLELAEHVVAGPAEVWSLLRHMASTRQDVHMQGPADPAQAKFTRL